MKGKFVYSLVLFAGLLFAGSDFLFAQSQSGSSSQQQKSYKYHKHSKSSKYGKHKGSNHKEMNQMQDTSMMKGMHDNMKGMQDSMKEMQDTSKSYQYHYGKDRYKGMSDTTKYERGVNPNTDQQRQHRDNEGNYQRQGDYSNPSGVDRQGGIQNQGDYNNPNDRIHNQGDIEQNGIYHQKDTIKSGVNDGYNQMNDNQDKNWNKNNDQNLNHDKDMRLEKNNNLPKK